LLVVRKRVTLAILNHRHVISPVGFESTPNTDK